MTLSIEIAKAIRSLAPVLSQDEIARRLGVSKGYVNKILNPDPRSSLPANPTLQEMLDAAMAECDRRIASQKASSPRYSVSRKRKHRPLASASSSHSS